MATGFDWQTEEEANENEGQSIATAPHSRLCRFFTRLLILALLTLIALPLIFCQLRTQVVALVTTQTEADVLAAHALLIPIASINGTYSEREDVLLWVFANSDDV